MHSTYLQFFEFEVIAWDYDNSSVIQQTKLRRNSAYEYYYTFWSKGDTYLKSAQERESSYPMKR